MDSSPSVSNQLLTNEASTDNKSLSTISVINRQELIQKIEQLKNKWHYGIQFV